MPSSSAGPGGPSRPHGSARFATYAACASCCQREVAAVLRPSGRSARGGRRGGDRRPGRGAAWRARPPASPARRRSAVVVVPGVVRGAGRGPARRRRSRRRARRCRAGASCSAGRCVRASRAPVGGRRVGSSATRRRARGARLERVGRRRRRRGRDEQPDAGEQHAHDLQLRAALSHGTRPPRRSSWPRARTAPRPTGSRRVVRASSPWNAFARVPQPSLRAMRMNPQIRIGINMNVFSKRERGQQDQVARVVLEVARLADVDGEPRGHAA